LTLDLRIHLGQRIGTLYDAEQAEQVRQRVSKRRVQRAQRSTNLFAARCGIVGILDTEVAAQQLQHRQSRRRLGVRDRVGFEYFARRRYSRLELMEEPRLAGAGFRDHRDDLPVTIKREFESAPHMLEFALAPDELRQPASRRKLKMSS
jgi:hypothetical protein